MKILFVENHAVFAATVVEQFLCLHDVTIVPSVAEALEALAQAHFDVALVDYDLDDAKGDELVRRVRASGIRVALVAVSARGEGNQAMIEAGADAVCHKKAFANIEDVIRSARDAFEQTVLRVHLDPPRHGWIRMCFDAGARRVEIDASYTPCDSIGDLADALLALGQAGAEPVVAFNTEPEIALLRLRPHEGRVDLSLTLYSDHRLLESTAQPLLECALPAPELLRAFLRPLRALRRAMPEDVYAAAWGHAFPRRAIEQLEERVNRGT